MRRSNGFLVYFINGEEQGVAATNLPQLVYAVVDIYGQCSKIRVTSTTAPDASAAAVEAVPEVREEKQRSESDMSGDGGYLRFHSHCGENAELQDGGRTVVRINPYDEYTSATAFTCRPLRPGETFAVTVNEIIEYWSGSLQMGW